MNQYGINVLISYLLQLPIYLVWLAGIVIALRTWKQHPRVSLFALLGIGLWLAASLGFTALTTLLPVWLHTQGMPFGQMGMINGVVGIARSLVTALAYGFLLAAVFGWRKASA